MTRRLLFIVAVSVMLSAAVILPAPFIQSMAASDTPQVIISPNILQQIPQFQIANESLPEGTIGTAYSAQLQAVNGITPFYWSVEEGSLPPGLILDSGSGVISGTPTTAGDYTFAISVSDSSIDILTREKMFTVSVAGDTFRFVEVIPLFSILPAPPENLEAVFGPDYPTTSLTWTDNSTNETGFEIWRKTVGAGDYELLMKTGADVTAEYDRGNSGLPGEEPMLDMMLQSPNTTFFYKVKSYNTAGYSNYSNEAWYTTPAKPADVSDFRATVLSGTSVHLSWEDNSDNETGFIVHRGPKIQLPPDSWGLECKDIKLGANTTECTDTGLTMGKTYVYIVYAYNPYPTNYITGLSLEVTPSYELKPKLLPGKPLTITLRIGDPNMLVNDISQEIDPGRGSAPVIVNGRTMLPVRALIEAMGGSLTWDESERKVVVQNGSTKIEVWIGSSSTRVNGVEKLTDVPPVIINDRTMLPLRYITENLGCTVKWDPNTKEVVVEFIN
jgi:titin